MQPQSSRMVSSSEFLLDIVRLCTSAWNTLRYMVEHCVIRCLAKLVSHKYATVLLAARTAQQAVCHAIEGTQHVINWLLPSIIFSRTVTLIFISIPAIFGGLHCRKKHIGRSSCFGFTTVSAGLKLAYFCKKTGKKKKHALKKHYQFLR